MQRPRGKNKRVAGADYSQRSSGIGDGGVELKTSREWVGQGKSGACSF